MGLVSSFKEYFKSAVGQTLTKDKITDAITPILTNESVSRISSDAVSKISSLGIGIPLAFLGEFLAIKKRESPTARAIARILGAKIDEINRDFILEKLKDEQYYNTVRDKVLNVTKTASIDEFTKLLGENYSPGEAWEVYRQIKDLVLDAEIFTISTGVSNIPSNIRDIVNNEVKSLKNTLEEKLAEAEKRLEESFKRDQTELHLLESNLQLVTSIKKYGKGNPNCWKEAYFRDADIKNGYDARRSITDDIIRSVKHNLGTIVYGKPHYGKTISLKRVMFEEIEEDGYAVVYAKEGVQANANLFIELLNRVLHNYPTLLVIADNVHKSGSEVLFQAFNEFAEIEDQANDDYSIRFLFGARKKEFDLARDNITDWNLRREVNDALKIINQVTINFEKQDAILFLKQALFVTKKDQSQPSEEGIEKAADILYNSSKMDPLFFISALKYILQGKSETFDFIDYIKTDIMKKIESLGNEEGLWKAALLCSFMGMCGIMPIQVDKLHSAANKILECGCGSTYQYYLEYLSSGNEPFLFREESGVYFIRHEHWALEVLIFIYCKEFGNYLSELFRKQRYQIEDFGKIKELIKDQARQLIACFLSNIEINDHLSILNRCSYLYNDYERSKPICKLVVNNYVVPDKMNDSDKAKIYCYGLGNFYSSTNEYSRSIQFYDKALEIDPDLAAAWNNKGTALYGVGDFQDALKCLDKALEINPEDGTTWFNKGLVLDKLGKDEEAIPCYDTAIRLNRI